MGSVVLILRFQFKKMVILSKILFFLRKLSLKSMKIVVVRYYLNPLSNIYEYILYKKTLVHVALLQIKIC